MNEQKLFEIFKKLSLWIFSLWIFLNQVYAGDPMSYIQDRWCYRSDKDRLCGGRPGRCIRNENGSEGGFVADTAFVEPSAFIGQYARICKNARILEDASVFDNAQVSGDAQIFGEAQIFEKAQVSGRAQVSERAQVFGNARIFGDAQVSGDVWVYGKARVFGKALLFGNRQIFSEVIQDEIPDSNTPFIKRQGKVNRATFRRLKIKDKACGICLYDFNSEDFITRPNCDCKVGYCPRCLGKAFQYKSSCPTCRGEILTGSLEIYQLQFARKKNKKREIDSSFE